jgi:uncharacterized RDD family membrane protein YckC/DNA-binding transcriptional ArsR family regulator
MANATSEDVSSVLLALSHPLRRQILLTLSEKDECSFTDMLNALKVDTGKLSFHLRSLSAFVEQTPSNKYRLSKAGENALLIISDIQSWAETADIRKKASQLPLASLKKRTFAFLIDFLIAIAIATPISINQLFLFSTNLNYQSLIAALGAIFMATLVILWTYSTLLESFNGQTLGKRFLGLKVVKTDGKKLSYDQDAVRNFGKAFLLPFDLAAGLHLKDKKFLRYFDKYAGTTVVTLRLNPVESTSQT